jgi:hypothetical protein
MDVCHKGLAKAVLLHEAFIEGCWQDPGLTLLGVVVVVRGEPYASTSPGCHC